MCAAIRKKRQAAARRKTSAPDGYVTRAVLCSELGISERDARALAAKGILKADDQNGGNFAVYSSDTLQQLRLRKAQGTLWDAPSAPRTTATAYSTEQGVRVFELIRAKVPADRIVIDERLHPQVFLQIRRDYEQAVGELDLPRATVARLNALAARADEAPVHSSEDLLLFIEKLAQPRLCPHCDAPSADLCVGCVFMRRRRAR